MSGPADLRTRWAPADYLAMGLGLILLAGWIWLAVRDAALPGWLALLAAIAPAVPSLIRMAALEPEGDLARAPLCGTRRQGHKSSALGFASVSAMALSVWILEVVNPSGALRAATALLPVPVFVGLIWVYVDWIRGMDEFRRKVALESMAVAYPATLVLAFGVDMVQRAGFLPEWTMADVLWPWMVLLWVPGLGLAWARYR